MPDVAPPLPPIPPVTKIDEVVDAIQSIVDWSIGASSRLGYFAALYKRITIAVRTALEHTQPEIAADVIDQGITMTGGGSLLREFCTVLQDSTGLPVRVADDAMSCVALGAGRDPSSPRALSRLRGARGPQRVVMGLPRGGLARPSSGLAAAKPRRGLSEKV